MTKTLQFAAVSLLALCGATPMSTPSADTAVHGEYLEARTASVFAGACHYAGERVTDGRSALLSWKIEAGSFGGVDLSNVKVIAAVSCDDNLAETSASRKSELVIDAANDQVVQAAAAWVKQQVGPQIGVVLNTRRGTIAFSQSEDGYRVSSAQFAKMQVRPMPDRACCLQPNMVWYSPIMTVQDRRVGYAQNVECNATHINDEWQRADENDAFYGKF